MFSSMGQRFERAARGCDDEKKSKQLLGMPSSVGGLPVWNSLCSPQLSSKQPPWDIWALLILMPPGCDDGKFQSHQGLSELVSRRG